MNKQKWIRVFANEYNNPRNSPALERLLDSGWKVVNMIVNNSSNAYTDFILDKGE